MRLSFQCAQDGPRTPARRLRPPPGCARRRRRALLRSLRSAGRRTAQLHAGAPRFRQADGDRLFCRGRSVFPFADVMHLFTDELTGLRARRLPGAFVLAGTFQRFFFRHDSLPDRCLDAAPMPMTAEQVRCTQARSLDRAQKPGPKDRPTYRTSAKA